MANEFSFGLACWADSLMEVWAGHGVSVVWVRAWSGLMVRVRAPQWVRQGEVQSRRYRDEQGMRQGCDGVCQGQGRAGSGDARVWAGAWSVRMVVGCRQTSQAGLVWSVGWGLGGSGVLKQKRRITS